MAVYFKRIETMVGSRSCRFALLVSLAMVLFVLMSAPGVRAEGPIEPVADEWLLRELVAPELPVAMQNQLVLHGLFSDGMVLQRERPVPVWGWGPEGAEVEVHFAGACVKTIVTGHHWTVNLPAMPACSQGRELTVICGTRCIVLKDVLVGDVWLCSGQSNMGIEMKLIIKDCPSRAADLENANNPLVRFFKIDRGSSRQPRRDIPPVRDDIFEPWWDAFLDNQWRPCTKQWAQHVSATAFYFSRELQPQVGCPLGILISARGGTAIDCWVPAEVVKREACWKDCRSRLAEIESKWAQSIASLAVPWRNYKLAYPTMKALFQAQQLPNHKPIRSPGQLVWPSCFYNGMIHPLAPFALKGVLWYQGETDAGNPTPYTNKMVNLIDAWRGLWQRPDLPFIVAQLAGFSGGSDGQCDTDKGRWAELRAAQARVPALVPNVYLASLIDAGMRNNIHPSRKDIAGARLALVARKEVYHEAIAAYGPAFQRVVKKGGSLVITFAHGETGLLAKEVDLDGVHLPAGILRGFMICGQDRRFIKAEAQIDGDQVIVSSPQVSDPVAVRYAWADFPLANLYNKEGLPAIPFQAEIAENTTP